MWGYMTNEVHEIATGAAYEAHKFQKKKETEAIRGLVTEAIEVIFCPEAVKRWNRGNKRT